MVFKFRLSNILGVLSDSDPYWINWNAILIKKGIR